jgi:hypothetical protein
MLFKQINKQLILTTMSNVKSLLLAIVLVLTSSISFAQLRPVDQVNKQFNDKVSEMYTKYKTDGFITYKGGNINMEKNTEFPIFVELQEGRWYQFMVIGDPEAKKIEMKLGLEGFGDIITDKFKTENTNEYYTQFSFVCPRSGRYLMTFFQKGPKRDMLGHVAILQRPSQTSNGTAVVYKH